MKLSAIAMIQTNFPDAHFWVIRRGSAGRCGEPVRVFNPEHIGIKVTNINLLLPDYLFYVMMAIHHSGHWEREATGSLDLVNIRVRDIQKIELSPQQ